MSTLSRLHSENGSRRNDSETAAPIKLAVVDDNEDAIALFVACFEESPEFRVALRCHSGREALKTIPFDPPDVVLMDNLMPGMSGIECLSRIKSLMPHIRALILSAFGDCELVIEAFLAGADGFLLKSDGADELRRAVREVLAGGAPISREVRPCVVQMLHRIGHLPGMPELSERERQVLVGILEGKLDKEIAEDVHIGMATVHTHVQRLFAKLRVHSRREVIRKFLEIGNSLDQ